LCRRLYTAIAIALASAVVLSIVFIPPLRSCLTPHATTFRGRCPIIAVYFYVWYGRHRHWNQSLSSLVIDRPVIGFYSSDNDSVIRWQLSEIKRAGIDALFISWWGPGSYEDRVAQKVFRYLRLYGLKAAILVEPFKPWNILNAARVYGPAFWRRVLNYIYKHFVEPYPHVYLRIGGKPLVLCFAPVGVFYRPHDPRFVIRVVAIYVDLINALRFLGLHADWDLWPNYLLYTNTARIELRIRVDGYVALTPRYYPAACVLGYYPDGCWVGYLDPHYRQRIYVKEWKWVIHHLKQIHIIAIYSWNEYHERSEIEPHIDATASNGLYPYEVTKEFAHLVHELCRRGSP